MMRHIVVLISFYVLVCAEQKTCRSGYFGIGCRHECHCANSKSCNVTSGVCPGGCDVNWSGKSCQKYIHVFNTLEDFSQKGRELVEETSDVTCHKTDVVTIDLKQNFLINTIHIIAPKNTRVFGWEIVLGEDKQTDSIVLCKNLSLYSNEASFSCDAPQITRFVTIKNSKGFLYICQLSIKVCSKYRFGTDCERECACQQPAERCETAAGVCLSGCRVGRTGDTCEKECTMSHGPNCIFKCGHCANDTCDAESGICLNGCDPGWQGLLCTDKCLPGTYGLHCEEICGHCFLNGNCDHVDGRCPNGCQAGWTGPSCKSECGFGKYGINCAFDCGHCEMISRCNKSTGICQTGCRPGWIGMFCTQVCPNGYFGIDCKKKCGHCFEDDCNKETGHCTKLGCTDGWQGVRCDKECDGGSYGTNCKETCGHCRHNDLCSPVSGDCPNGCNIGYHGSTCNQECLDGFYGDSCSIQCGFCLENEPCNKVTGICPRGCVESYTGDRCKEDEFSDPTQPLYKVIIGVSIAICGAIMTCVVACLVINWRREDISHYDVESKSETAHLDHNETGSE